MEQCMHELSESEPVLGKRLINIDFSEDVLAATSVSFSYGSSSE